MKHVFIAMPLILAIVLWLSAAIAQSGMQDAPSVAPEWVGIFASYGLAGVLVAWWIIKGYPMWLAQWSADLAKQREEFHGWRHEIAGDIHAIRQNLDGRPCMLANDSLLSRLLQRVLDNQEKLP